jgi:hypothetical protein
MVQGAEFVKPAYVHMSRGERLKAASERGEKEPE